VKTSSLLLTLSLAANVALAAAFILRAPAPTPTTSTAARATAATSGDGKASDALRQALASGDGAALQAAGIPADLANQLMLGRAFGRFAEKMRAAQNKAADGRWWRRAGASSTGNLNREQMLAARRELSEAMLAAFGDDLGIGGTDNSQLAFLAPAKRDALRRIVQDYDEMLAKFGGDGVQLASDREKQKMLRAERDRDIAALLSPDELAAYEMRTSATAATIRQRYGDAIESEDDFKKIYALQKAFDEKFPALSGRVTPDMMAARADAARQLQDDLRDALGGDKYAALRRAADTEIRTLDSLASRLNLPANTTDNIVAARDVFAMESQRINADTSLTPAQRRAQLQELGNRARADVVRTLGTEGTEAYAQRSAWLNMLQSGMAFSTTPQPGSPGGLALTGGPSPSVYPVLPAGASGGGAVRQMVVNGVTTADSNAAAPTGGIFMLPAGGTAQRDNVQVMTFTATSTEGPSSATSTTTGGGTSSGTVTTPAPTPKQ
jgi:hypothetical protein